MAGTRLVSHINNYIGVMQNLVTKLHTEVADESWADAYFSTHLLNSVNEAVHELLTLLAEEEARSLVVSETLVNEIEDALDQISRGNGT